MSDRKSLTTESGAPVADNQHSQTAGPNGGPDTGSSPHRKAGPLRARANPRASRSRERLWGLWRVYRHEGPQPLHQSQVPREGRENHGTAHPLLDCRGREGFCRHGARSTRVRHQFYTEDGNYDLVGNDTPIFFLRDPLKFPDFIHSQKRDPHTNVQEPDNVWDFFSLSPEATHQFVWLFGRSRHPRELSPHGRLRVPYVPVDECRGRRGLGKIPPERPTRGSAA